MTITIKGDCPSKKNSKQIFRNRNTGKPFIVSSESYKLWHQQAMTQLQRTRAAEHVSSIELIFFPQTKRRSDLTNKAESIMDLLVDAKIIEDDNWFVVPKVSLAFGLVDKENPRVEVTLHS